jgi:hypothetical protein
MYMHAKGSPFILDLRAGPDTRSARRTQTQIIPILGDWMGASAAVGRSGAGLGGHCIYPQKWIQMQNSVNKHVI